MLDRGPLGKDKKDFIRANAVRMSSIEIAKKINRSVAYVEKYIALHVKAKNRYEPLPEKEATRVTVRQELRGSVKWKRMKEELTQQELEFFEEEYVALMSQFGNDVLTTEENQIFDAIKFEVLKTRNMVARRKALEEIARLEKLQEAFYAKYPTQQAMQQMSETERTYTLSLENQLNISRSNEQSRTTEYVKLQERVDKLMQSLKATRDQRVTKIESSKVNFLGVIKMLQERDVQEHEGRQIGLTKLAADTEYDRLGRPHKYEDNNEDSPILSPETVDLGPEEPDDVDVE